MQNISKLLEYTSKVGPEDTQVYINPETASKTVFVADLPRTTTYCDLAEIFEKNIGPCLIAIKRPLFKNFYFAFVQFNTLEHAKKVLTEMKFPEVRGTKVRVLPFNKGAQMMTGESSSSSTSFQLFVKGMPKEWTHEDLYKTFESYGTILSSKISIDANFTSRGYGFVQFEKAEAAQKAMKEMDGKSLSEDEPTAKLVVCEYVPSSDRHGTQKPRCLSNLYVKNFPKKEEFGDEDLLKLFTPYGEIISAVVMKDENNVSRGFGFVCFKDWQDAQKALEKITEEQAEKPEEIKLYVREAKSKDQRQNELAKQSYQFKKSMQMLNLVVKNIDEQTTDQELSDFFSSFGGLKNIKWIPESHTAFVCYNDREGARAAREQVNQMQFKGRTLFVNYCEPKESRRAALEEMYDRKAYEKSKMKNAYGGSQDVLTLLQTLGLLMTQMQQGQTRERPQRPQQRTFGHALPQNQPQHRDQQHQQNNWEHRPKRPERMPRPNQNNQHHQREQQMPQPVGLLQQPLGMGINNPMPHQQALYQIAPPIAMTPEQFKAAQYAQEVQTMFCSPAFMKGTMADRQQLVGTAIYKHVEALAGEKYAPKVTGMIIDLPPHELNISVMTMESLSSKIKAALTLLVENGQIKTSEEMPPALQEPKVEMRPTAEAK